jgi:hypothetical protein
MNTNLLKEAIAEADAIKKMAIENAKASLNEAFDSKVKAMLAARLSEEVDELEEEYDEEMDPDKEKMEEKKQEKEEGDDEGYGMEEEAERDIEGDADEAFDLDKIIAELEKGEKGEKGDDSDDDDEKKEVMEVEDEGGDDMEPQKEGKKSHSDDDDSDDDDSEEENGDDDNEKSVDEEIDIAALLAEMEGDLEEEMEEAKDEESDDKSYVGEGEDKGVLMALLTPILKKIGIGDDVIQKMQSNAQVIANALRNAKGVAEEKGAEVEEIKEIKRQAAELAQKVNETNLINAKLLYLNKILRKYNLSEQQKLKVISAFDKAGTTREAKIVHESLDQAFSVKNDNTKVGLKESMGFASKAAGTSTKRVINEGVITDADAQVSRWQKLAGIIK